MNGERLFVRCGGNVLQGVAMPLYMDTKVLLLEDYIEHLLTVMPERLADDPDADIDDLLPWADDIQKRFAMFGTKA